MTHHKETVIVFGGSGFLGSHVADALITAGYSVRIFDRVKSPYLQSPQEMIVGDIMDVNSVIQATRGCDIIYNFAGIADIDEASLRPLETIALNVMGNVHTLEAARVNKIRRYVFASSVYVYSGSGSFYRASKQASEHFVEAYSENYALEYTILRYGSVYGRRADHRNGIYRFLRQALENKSITFHGNPDAVREYIHAEDAARLSVKILDAEYANRNIIITGYEKMKVKDFMRLIAEIVPGKIELLFEDNYQTGHYVMTPYSFNPKIGHKLVATDHVDLGQGILDCLAEISENKQHEHSSG